MESKALEHGPTIAFAVLFLVKMVIDHLKKRSNQATSYEGDILKKTIEQNAENAKLNAENSQQIRELANSIRTMERDHNSLKEHATEGLKYQRKELEELKAWRIDTNARLEAVFTDYSARTVTFTTAEEAKAARASNRKK